MLVWVQVPGEEVKELFAGKCRERKVEKQTKEKVKTEQSNHDSLLDEALARGRTYHEGKVIMIEFPVDSIIDEEFKALHKYIDVAMEKNGGIGANMSWFRKDKKRKPLLLFDQDECIFKQFLLNKKAWMGSDGRFSCQPKDNGQGLMVSAFQSRNFGFGFHLFEKHKAEINRRRKGQQYHDNDAAMTVRKTADKDELTTDPFIRLFEYGNAEGKEGYWL